MAALCPHNVRTMSALCSHNISLVIHISFVRCYADIVRTMCGHISPGIYVRTMSALYPSWVFSSRQKHGNGYITKNIHIFFGISRDLIEKSLEDMAKRADAGVMPSRVTIKRGSM